MYCQNCGNKIGDEEKFCGKCGNSTTKESLSVEKKKEENIKCGNCGYIGPGERARSTWAKVLAWICVVFAPLITIIYFLATHKYKCPKCKSTFLGIQKEDGTYSSQGGTSSPIMIVVWIFVGIVVVGIMSSVILASLNSARAKGTDAAIKADLSNAGAGAALYYDTQTPNSYGYTSGCGDQVFAATDVSASISDIFKKGGIVTCYASGNTYSMSSTLKGADKTYCIDSTGVSSVNQTAIYDSTNSEAKCSANDNNSTNTSAEQTNNLSSLAATTPAKPTNSSFVVDGTKIKVIKDGTGIAIVNGQTAVVQYTGTLADGSVFDSTTSHGGQPFSFVLGAGQVIKGWDEGVLGMKVGEERTLIIPPSSAYGTAGYPPVIPQNATLTFDVILIGIQ